MLPAIYTLSSTTCTLPSTIGFPQCVIRNTYVCTHNTYPQYICLYILWVCIVGAYVCIVGAYVYIVGDIVHCVVHNMYVLSTMYRSCVHCGCITLVTHNIYPQYIQTPTMCTHNVYSCIYCGHVLWVLYLCIVGAIFLCTLWV